MPIKVVGLGEILWDIFPSEKKLGGAPANFAYHARAIGNDTVHSSVASCVGSDPLGEEIISTLEILGVSCDHLCKHSQYPTGTVTVKLDSNGMPSYIIDEGVAWDYLPFFDIDFANDTDIVCFGSLAQRSSASREVIVHFLDAMPRGALKIFDVNLRQSFYSLDVIDASLKKSNVLKINDKELTVLGGLMELPSSQEDAMKLLVERYHLNLGVLTKGENGSILVSGNEISSFPGLPANVVDSVGAGDAFTAAVAIGLSRKDDLGSINERANRLAAFVCESSGATPGLPDEVIAMFR